MAINARFLFDRPQSEVASLIVDRIRQSSATSIVTGFVTPSGVDAISAPMIAQPSTIDNIIVGAATYPGFEALDALLAAGVPAEKLHVHLGHTRMSGGRKNPFARYHPMLHSKIYYMELPGGEACAFVGSHNMTSFALLGQNGEAAVFLEGPANSVEFDRVRQHIALARTQSIVYKPEMKEALAWWTREFIEGMKAEMEIPLDSTTVRTILIFACAAKAARPKKGDQLYFEIPTGIEQIESLKTEAHLFLFDTLPKTAREAMDRISAADASYKCVIQGVENRQGNREVAADWRIDLAPSPLLVSVPNSVFRPATASGMQQVRAEVDSSSFGPFDYLFDRPRVGWDPLLFDEEAPVPPSSRIGNIGERATPQLTYNEGWKLVKGLTPRAGEPRERDQAALRLAAPDSGSFVLVSLRRRLKRQAPKPNTDER